MTEATNRGLRGGGLRELVAAYDAGQYNRQELVEKLTLYPYTRGTYPPGTYDAYIPGSWDELTVLVVNDIITQAEFDHILARVSARAKG